MAKYFDRKEQVIEIELTPHGKNVFAAGKFTPKFYSFHDDDILYDQDYQPSGSIQKTLNTDDVADTGGGSRGFTLEGQNDIVGRIKETPRLSIYETHGWQFTHRRKSPEITFATGEPSTENINFLDVSPDKVTLANAKFLRAIGTSDAVKDFAPAWEIKAMDDSEPLSVSGTEEFPYRGGASGSEIIVPFFSASLPLEYDVKSITVNVDEDNVILPTGGEEITRDVFVKVKDGRLLLDVQELNTYFKGNGNFDIEVFRVSKNQNRNRNENPEFKRLSFINETFQDAESMRLQTEPEIYSTVIAGGDEVIDRNIPILDPTYVEYFLSIRVDTEIDDITSISTGETLYDGQLNNPIDPCED
tara:strand:- start:269 stop:1345 length:1077 start_codon:yes stop_codon:yes gene_type:complete